MSQREKSILTAYSKNRGNQLISSVFACFLPNSTAYRDIDHSHAVLYGSSLVGSQVSSLPKPYKPRCHLCHNSGLPAGLPHPVRRPEFPRVFPYTFSAPTDEPLMNAAPLPLKEHLPCQPFQIITFEQKARKIKGSVVK